MKARDIGSAHFAQRRERNGAAGMRAEKCKELAEIAAIGFERLGREAAHGAEIALPLRDQRCQVRIGEEGGGHETILDRAHERVVDCREESTHADPVNCAAERREGAGPWAGHLEMGEGRHSRCRGEARCSWASISA